MTADIEQDLRQIFEADAAQAPLPHDLADGARRRARQQAKRHRRVAVLACAAVAVLLVGGIAVLERPTTDGSAPAATGRPDPSAAVSSPSAPSSFGPVVPERPALSFHNVEVPVPASMLDPSRVECGRAVADAAYVLPRPPTCFIDRIGNPQLTTVVLQPWTDQVDHNVGGKLSSGVLPDGRTRLVTRIPSSDLQLVVTSPDGKRAQRLFDGLVIVQMSHGCAVKDTSTRSSTLPSATVVTGGSACVYDSTQQLASSGWLDRKQAQRIVAALALAQQPVPCPYLATPPDGIDHWTVHLRLPTGEAAVRIAGNRCQTENLRAQVDQVAPPPRRN